MTYTRPDPSQTICPPCNGRCDQGRLCPARMRIERDRDRNSGAVVITITMLSAMFCLSVFAGMIWGLRGLL